MKLTNTLLAIAFGAFTLSQSQAVEVFNFQTGEYTVEDSYNFGEPTIDANGLTVSGDEFGGSISVLFSAPANPAGLTEFTLTGTLHSENYGTSFTLTLFDSSFNQANYTGMFDYGSGRSTITLTAEDLFQFALSDLIGFTFATASGEAFDYTFESIEAVPEPSVYALTFLAAGGAYLLRRRRAMSNR